MNILAATTLVGNLDSDSDLAIGHFELVTANDVAIGDGAAELVPEANGQGGN